MNIDHINIIFTITTDAVITTTSIIAIKNIRDHLFQQMEGMIHGIREVFIENLKTFDWIDEETRKASKEKVIVE